jgi:hypothetical protein
MAGSVLAYVDVFAEPPALFHDILRKMKFENSPPRYRWRRTWSGKIGDFTADDGGRRFARIVHKPDNRPAQAWNWSLSAFKDKGRCYFAINGFAETARLAVRDAEDAYDGGS